VNILTQPSVIEGLGAQKDFRGEGLLARFWYCFPESNAGQKKFHTEGTPEAVNQEYERRITALLNLPWDCTQKDVLYAPFALELSNDALKEIEAYFYEIESQISEDGKLYPIADWAEKVIGTTARIAGLLHLAGVEHEPQNTEVSGETMANAITLSRYFLEHTITAFGLMKADPVQELAKRLSGWIIRKNLATFTLREATRALRVERHEVEAPLRLLIERGYIREVSTQAALQVKVGRPKASISYEVNPEFTNTKGATL
jgi:hypothetical protein